jgi:putative hydrolases of HD superfamily
MFENTPVSPFLEFILATEKLKGVERRTSVIGTSRRENSAEHSWQVALLAMVLKDLSFHEVCIDRVIKLLLVHDLPEIIVGDNFFYSNDREGNAASALSDREREGAVKLFSTLPDSVANELMELWEEFEKRESPEAKFAHALDRIMPGLQNYFSNGGTWKEFYVSLDTAKKKNMHVKEGSIEISDFIYAVLKDASEKDLFGA